jgi:hypothetical protein
MDYTWCSGFGCRTLVNFDAATGSPLEMKSLLQQELLRCGVLWSGFHNVSFSHDDGDVNYALDAYREALPLVKEAVESGNIRGFLRGEPVEPVFRRAGNFNTKPKTKAEAAR